MQIINGTRAEKQAEVYGGVDTHRDVHMAAAVDQAGRLLGTESFEVSPAGYAQLGRWLRSHGCVVRVGVEGTGSYGAGLSRYLTREGVDVAEVIQPNRQLRRRRGKTDTVDAYATARGEADVTPKAANGVVEATRTLYVGYESAVQARTRTVNQLKAISSQLLRVCVSNWTANPPPRLSRRAPGSEPPAAMWSCAAAREP